MEDKILSRIAQGKIGIETAHDQGVGSQAVGYAPNTDEEYWTELLKNYENCSDPLASVLKELSCLADYAKVINKVLPSCIDQLKEGRGKIVIQTNKTFSDILSMIEVFNDGEESLYETAQKICEHYRQTKLGV